MTKWGNEIASVDEEQLRQQLRTESDGKAVKRFTSAVAYKQGKSRKQIERLLGFPEQMVYDWIDTVAERDLIGIGLVEARRSSIFPPESPDEGNELAASNIEGEAIEHLPVVDVAERNIIECDLLN